MPVKRYKDPYLDFAVQGGYQDAVVGVQEGGQDAHAASPKIKVKIRSGKTKPPVETEPITGGDDE